MALVKIVMGLVFSCFLLSFHESFHERFYDFLTSLNHPDVYSFYCCFSMSVIEFKLEPPKPEVFDIMDYRIFDLRW